MKEDKKEEARIKKAIRAEMEKAIGRAGETLSEVRTQLKASYFGKPFDADIERREAGWSTYQDRSVLEAVEWAKPGLLRVFASMDDIVRFEPTRPGQEQNADDATDYINNVVFGGKAFSMIHDVIHDALTQRVAWAKVYMDTPEPYTNEYSGLNEEEVQAVMSQAGNPAEVEVTQEQDGFRVVLPINNPSPKVRVEALPPEHVLWSKEARNIEECRFVAHWEDRTIAELLAEGYSRKDLEDLPMDEAEAETYPETDIQMEINSGGGYDDQAELEGDMRRVRVYEAYIKLPNKEGGTKRYKVVFVGEEACKILDYEEWRLPRPPLFPVSSVPLPHEVGGLCLADQMMDIQLLRTELWRQMLDSLALSNQGEYIIAKGSITDKVNMDQLTSRRVGGVYQTIGDVRVYALPTDSRAAQEATAALQQTDILKEVRTGIGQQIRGLSADALQNTATGAVIMEDSANQRLEMIARFLAEMFFKPVAKYVLVLVSRHQNKPIQARMHGRFYQWNPTLWDPEMDVSVSVGLGTGNRAKQSQALQMVLMYQEKLMQAFSDKSPARVPQMIRALHKLCYSLGFNAPEVYFGTIDDAVKADQMLLEESKRKEQEGSPEAKKEKQKMQIEQQKATAKAQLDMAKAQQDFALKQHEAQAKIQLEAEKNRMNAQLQKQKIDAERVLDQTRMMVENRANQGTTQIRQAMIR